MQIRNAIRQDLDAIVEVDAAARVDPGRVFTSTNQSNLAVLLIDFLCASAGGPLYCTGRDMKNSHRGMRIDDGDWSSFLGHLSATLEAFRVPRGEHAEVVAFIQSTKPDIVEA